MEVSFKWKFWGTLTAALLALYALTPSILNWHEKREALESSNQALPWYFRLFPEKGLNLGLDLQGGIYAELDVEIRDAVATRLTLVAQDLFRDLKQKGIEPSHWEFNKDKFAIQAAISDENQKEKVLDQFLKFRQLVNGNYVFIFKEKTSETPGENDVFLEPTDDYQSNIQEEVMHQATQSVRNRIDRYGLAEPTVQRQGTTRIIVELPGVKDPDRALRIVQQAGSLEFKMVSEKISSVTLSEWMKEAKEKEHWTEGYSWEEVEQLNTLLKKKIPNGHEIAFEVKRNPETKDIIAATPYLLENKAYLTGKMLENAQVNFDNNEPYVSISFNHEGAKLFGELTKAHVKERLAILLDGFVHSAPSIREPILGGQAKIELGYGNRTELLKEAQDLTLVLQEGALPARLKEASKTVIGPSLGAESIQKSFQAMIYGAAFVILFMILYYKWSGVLADVVLIFNTLFIFAFLAMFQATLTLPGIAGIVLTIGMAVDANVLIFERIREELIAGQLPRNAVDLGYGNAIRAILDSNLTTIIAGIILYQFGTGPIKGFAVTLIIGLVCNLFTAVTLTRTVFDFFIIKRKMTTMSI